MKNGITLYGVVFIAFFDYYSSFLHGSKRKYSCSSPMPFSTTGCIVSFAQYNIPPDDLALIFFIFALAILLCLGLIVHLYARLKRLLRGNARSIEETLVSTKRDVEALLAAKDIIEKRLAILDIKQKKSVQGVGTVRFNPFKGTSGSNQSFTTAFVNGEGDGVVMSSLYSRERVSLFAKPIKKFASEYELTEEEREALKKASSVNS